jgi:hypothetical protein
MFKYKITFCLLLLLYALTNQAESTNQLLIDNLKRVDRICNSESYALCVDQFSGTNRGFLSPIVEIKKYDAVKEIYDKYVSDSFKDKCDQSELLYINANFNQFNMTINYDQMKDTKYGVMEREEDSAVAYYLPNNSAIVLVPTEKGYLIGFNDVFEEIIEKQDFFPDEIKLIKTINTIMLYHLHKAKTETLTCTSFIKSINEAFAPIINILPGEDNKKISAPYLKKDISEILNFYGNIEMTFNIESTK